MFYNIQFFFCFAGLRNWWQFKMQHFCKSFRTNYMQTVRQNAEVKCIFFSKAPKKLFSTENITKSRLFKYNENFTTKIWKFSDKNSDIFHISAQNRDYGYSLEPTRRGGSNKYPQSMFLRRNKHYENTPIQIYWKFYHQKMKIFRWKILIFFIFLLKT